MNASFLVSVCGIKRKKFTSVPMKEVDINFHFHEQYLMSQDKTSYNFAGGRGVGQRRNLGLFSLQSKHL